MRNVMFALLIVAMAPPMSVAQDTAPPPVVDAPPPGYESTDAVKLAILAGRIKLINPMIEVPPGVKVRKDIEYGKSGEQVLKLDLYTPTRFDVSSRTGGASRSAVGPVLNGPVLNGPVPGIIFIHGGAWKGGQRSDYHYYGVKFAEQGYVVATITYRMLPDWPFPAAIQDAKCAVRWMRANAKRLHVNADLIGVVGGSAGGHLAMLVGYSSDVPELEGNGGHAGISSRVQAVVDLYGPVDLTTDFAKSNETVIKFMGGEKIDEARKQYELASPITHITKDDPPTLIFHGTIDETVPIAQADLLAEKLRTTGVPYRYDRLKGWPHAMDLADVVNRRCRRLMMSFFNEHLSLPEPLPQKPVQTEHESAEHQSAEHQSAKHQEPVGGTGVAPEVWLCAGDRLTALMESDASWPYVAEHLDGIKLYVGQLGKRRGQAAEATTARLKQLARFVKDHHLQVAVELGGCLDFGPMDATAGHWAARREIAALDNYYAAGGRVDFLDLDGPVRRLLHPNKRRDGKHFDSVPLAADQLVAALKDHHQAHPETRYWLLTNFPNWGWRGDVSYHARGSQRQDYGDYDQVVRTVLEKLKQADLQLEGVTVDNPFDYLIGAHHSVKLTDPRTVDWLGRVRSYENFANEQALSFNLIVNSERGGKESDERFVGETLQMVDKYREVGGHPRRWFVQSWYTYPKTIVPESNPHSMTALAKAVIERVKRPTP